MKTLLLASTAAIIAFAMGAAPVMAAVSSEPTFVAKAAAGDMLDKRRPRTPGGSGCDGKGDAGKPGC